MENLTSNDLKMLKDLVIKANKENSGFYTSLELKIEKALIKALEEEEDDKVEILTVHKPFTVNVKNIKTQN